MTRHYGPLPEVGRRVRHYHPWLEDHAVGTVTRIEARSDERWGEFDHEVRTTQYNWGDCELRYIERPYVRARVYLTDCEHWRGDHTWGPVPDTYFDNMAETWEYADDDDAGLATALSAADPAP